MEYVTLENLNITLVSLHEINKNFDDLWKVGLRCEHGLCSNTRHYIAHRYGIDVETGEIFSRYWKDWEFFTGDNNYPIPASLESRSIVLANEAFNDVWDMYNVSTVYGQLRKNLTEFLIFAITEDIERIESESL